MDWTTLILSVLSTVLGGTSIAQFMHLKSIKRTKEAEADIKENESLLQIIRGNTEEIKRLQERLDTAEAKNDNLQKELDDQREKYRKLENELNQVRKQLNKVI